MPHEEGVERGDDGAALHERERVDLEEAVEEAGGALGLERVREALADEERDLVVAEDLREVEQAGGEARRRAALTA